MKPLVTSLDEFDQLEEYKNNIRIGNLIAMLRLGVSAPYEKYLNMIEDMVGENIKQYENALRANKTSLD